MGTSGRASAIGADSWSRGIAGRRTVERAGSRTALALAAGHLALRFIGERQQGEYWSGPKQQDERQTDGPANPVCGLPAPVHCFEVYNRRRNPRVLPASFDFLTRIVAAAGSDQARRRGAWSAENYNSLNSRKTLGLAIPASAGRKPGATPWRRNSPWTAWPPKYKKLPPAIASSAFSTCGPK